MEVSLKWLAMLAGAAVKPFRRNAVVSDAFRCLQRLKKGGPETAWRLTDKRGRVREIREEFRRTGLEFRRRRLQLRRRRLQLRRTELASRGQDRAAGGECTPGCEMWWCRWW